MSHLKLRIFYGFMALILIGIFYVKYQLYKTEQVDFAEAQKSLTVKQGDLIVHQVEQEIAQIRLQMQALSENAHLFSSLSHFDKAEQLPENYFRNLKLFFPNVQGFFLVDREGEQFGSPYKIELGDACVKDIGSMLDVNHQDLQAQYKPILHPQFERVHFDMMFPTNIFGDGLLFFASYDADLIRQILIDHKLSEHTSFLIRQDSKYLIELYESAVRSTADFKRGFFLSDEEIANIDYEKNIAGTGWKLVVVRNSELYNGQKQDIENEALFQIAISFVFWLVVVVLVARYVEVQERLLGRLHEESIHDELTGLGNRRMLKMELPKTLQRYQRRGAYSALLYMDLNKFKPVNDDYGHDTGDEVLKQVGHRLFELSRVDDVLIRLGGDEFVVVLNELSQAKSQAVKNLQTALARYQDALNKPYKIGELELDVPPSIGSLLIDGAEMDPDTLIKQADHLMYQIKERGKRV